MSGPGSAAAAIGAGGLARTRWPARLAELPLGAALLLALACLGLHGSALGNGWHFDDPGVLGFVTRYSPWQYFAQYEVMKLQSSAFITPWGTLFYEIGLAFFDLQPRGYYAHMLLVLWADALVIWWLLRAALGGTLALAGGVLFLSMPATAAIAQTLMTGHYAYGLLFTLLSIAAWQRALAHASVRWALVSAGLYAMACLCKELYVPLPALLALWPAGPWRQRLALLLPVLAVAGAYTLLRLWLLGGIGGYPALSSGAGSGLELGWPAIPRALAGLRRLVVGPGWPGTLALLLGAGVVLLAYRRGRRLPAGPSAGAAVLLLLPVVPMLLLKGFPDDGDRLGLALGCTVALVLPWLAQAHRAAAWLLPPLALLLMLNQQPVIDRNNGRHDPSAAENAFLAQAHGDQRLLPHEFAQVGYRELMSQAAARVNGHPSAEVLPDIEALVALGPEQGRAVSAWRDECRCVQALGDDYARRVADHQRRLGAASGRPLRVQMSIERQGRYQVFRWRVEGAEGQPVFDIRRVGRLRLPREGALPFSPDALTPITGAAQLRVGLETPDGGLIRSPLLTVPLDHGAVSWSATATP